MKYQLQKVEYRSKVLNRGTIYNVWSPPNTEGTPLLIYLHGWGDIPENPVFIQAVSTLSEAGFLTPTVLMPWGFEVFECSRWMDRYDGTLPMETHVIKELIPEMEVRFKVQAGPHSRMICGFSMGGFGAINLAFHHQELFCSCAAWSPAGVKHEMKQLEPDENLQEEFMEWVYEMANTTPQEINQRIWGSLPEGRRHRIYNSPWHYLDEISTLSLGLIFNCGDHGFPESMIIPPVVGLHNKLLGRGIPHSFEQYRGEHCQSNSLEAISSKLLFMYDYYRKYAAEKVGSEKKDDLDSV